VRLGAAEARSLLLLVREAAALATNHEIKDELQLARKFLEDATSNRGGGEETQVISFSRVREILRTIIDEPRGESKDLLEKVAKGLGLLEELATQGFPIGLRPRMETAFGLHTATFDTLQGTVTVNLPDDIAAGDVISGTVIAEAKGKDTTEQAKNRDELNGYVVELEKQEATPGDQPARWQIPKAATTARLVLRSKGGRELAHLPIPVAKHSGGVNLEKNKDLKALQDGAVFQTPTVGQAGRALEIKGAFDGDAQSTGVMISGRPVRVLAESPRKVVAQGVDQVGRSEIEVAEQGKVVAKGTFVNVGVRLSAGKLNLLKGEQTNLTLTLLGLDNLQAPMSLQLDNRTPAVVRMTGGDNQLLLIHPKEVQGSSYTTTRVLTGVQPGGFVINATVVSNQTSASGTAAGLPSPGPDRQASNPTSGSTPIDRRNVNRPERPVTTQPSQGGEFGPDGEPRTGGGSRPVEPFRGRFRVTLNGFSVNHETADDRFERDGPGDEVTLVSHVATVESGSRLNRIIWGNIFTSVMGAQPQNEIRAGSASDRGGLRRGDGFPTAAPALRTTALNPGIPPTILFEGELVQGQNAAFIMPSIWEWDGLSRRELHDRYADAMDGARSNIIGFVGRLIQRPPPLQLQNYLLRGSVMGLGNIATIGHGPLGLGEVNNRPIGMLPVEGGFGFTPRVLILTYDAAREFARTDAGRGRGVIVVHYVDDAALEGSYSLFLQIEQVDVM
jgi:hypothetical protein